MSGRLPTGLMVSALRRLVEDAGGSATVLARGDDQSGTVLAVAVSRNEPDRSFERGMDGGGKPALVESTPGDGDVDAYWRRRRARDPDLWVIELDIPQAERFVAETILAG